MSGPWTAKQRALIRRLCTEVGGSYPSSPLPAQQASALIDGLLSRKRNRIYGRAAGQRSFEMDV
jgi:hypothetical protein